jgi:NADH-quinone oxidoreductase subunit E
MNLMNESTRKFEKVCEIINKYGRNPVKLIPILQEVQEEYRYLPEEIMTFVATTLDISPARVYGVATFFSHFTLLPKGKYIIRICDGTACHVKKSMALLEAIQKKLCLTDKKNTTEDMMFTLETVSCLGACGLAPVVVINEDVHGAMSPEKICQVIDRIIQQEVN